nr:hypothetical protein [Tanacetum cinerariifolium]
MATTIEQQTVLDESLCNAPLRKEDVMCDNGGEFINKEMNEFCTRKGIKREFSNARTPQQNGVAKRRNKTLIEATRTTLADAKLPVTFWAEAINTACYVQNRVLVNKVLIEKGGGPNWLFDIDTLTNSMNYVPIVVSGTSSTNISGTKDVASQAVKKDVSSLRYIALPNWFHKAHMESSNNDAQYACNNDVPESRGISNPTATSKIPPADQMESLTVKYEIPTVSSPVLTVCLDISPETTSGSRLISKGVISQEETPSLDNALILSNRFKDTIGLEANLSNMESSILASLTPTFRIHMYHPKSQIIGLADTPVQTRYKSKEMEEHSFIATIPQKTTPDLLQFCLFLCFLSQEEPKKIFDALKDPIWPPGFQDPEFPDRVYKVEKAMYGLHRASRAWYGTLSKYLLDNGFQRGTIDQTLFIRKHKGGFLLVQVYVDDIIFGSSNLQLYREFEALMHDKFQMSAMGELTFFLGLSANTPMDKENPWGKDGPGKDIELHMYRSMIGSLMYLTASRPDIMFAVCACARHQVTPKECHLHAVKRIFRYLKGHLKLGLWYPKESPFDLVAYLDSDYGGATQDRKLTIGGCQFLGRRLISWQCKKQTIMATSTTEAEYVAAASGCGQVL